MTTTRTIDDVLRDFYRAEMPAPWPVLKAPALLPQGATLPLPSRRWRRPWFRSLGRLAVAASVAFLLIGYLALASLFPTENPRAALKGQYETADLPGKKVTPIRVIPENVQTPGGREGKMIMEPIKGGYIFNMRERR